VSARRLVAWLVQFALLAAVAWGVFRMLGPELGRLSLSDLTRWRPRPLPLVLSFALLVGVYFMHALLWRRILSDLDIGRLSIRAAARVYFVSSLGRYLPGKLWQLAGLAVLSRREGLPPGASASAAVLGQFGFLTTGLLFLGIMLPEWRTALRADGTGGGNGAVGPLGVGAALLITGGALLWLLVATPVGHGFRHRLIGRSGSRAGPRVRAAFELADRVTPRSAALWASGYAASWVLLGVAFALFVSAFVPAAAAAPRYLAGAVAASYLAGYLIVIAPAGIGVREAAMLLILQPVVPDAGAALVVSVLSRVWFTAAELVPLGLLPLLPNGGEEGG
jgi:glycosyltransferase 2 family protein